MTIEIDDKRYVKVAEVRGKQAVYSGGYFKEEKEFNFDYDEEFDLPKNKLVLQYCGAFYPFHDGHLECIKNAVESFDQEVHVIIHADHYNYRSSKGSYDEKEYEISFHERLSSLGVPYTLIMEDQVPDNCSRNFTRLYDTLIDRGNDTWLVCGGDRANFVLAFALDGKCIVSGRDTDPKFGKYKKMVKLFPDNENRFKFIQGNNNLSSSQIRANTAESGSTLNPFTYGDSKSAISLASYIQNFEWKTRRSISSKIGKYTGVLNSILNFKNKSHGLYLIMLTYKDSMAECEKYKEIVGIEAYYDIINVLKEHKNKAVRKITTNKNKNG